MEISPLVSGHKVDRVSHLFLSLLTRVDPHLLTVGQLQWMDYELFLPALRPLFLSSGLAPSIVDRLVRDAQHDLYHPSYSPSTLIHIAYASKCF